MKIIEYLNKKAFIFKDFLIISFLTGLITGGLVSLFLYMCEKFTEFIFKGNPWETIEILPKIYVILIPVIAILLVNLIIYFDKSIKIYGVAQIADIVQKDEDFITLKSLILKLLAAVISISSGFAVGTEGPSAEIGAMVAVQLEKFFSIPAKFLKVIISVGASSGIAAVFVSPITGIAFALESIAYEFFQNYIIFIMVGAFSAFSISVMFFPAIGFLSPSGRVLNYDYIWLMGFFIPFMTFLIYFYLTLQDKILLIFKFKIFEKFGKFSQLIFALTGGVFIGLILLIDPRAAFTGHNFVEILFNEFQNIPFKIIILILFLRIFATTISNYSNAVGGMFLPLMSIGALGGYGFGEAVQALHLAQIQPYYFAAIGAAIFMGVLMKLPFTAVVLALEITNDYNVVLATGFGVGVIMYMTKLKFNLKKLNTVNINFSEIINFKKK